MKVLFLATQTMTPTQGICRKIWAQCEGFRANGAETIFCCLKEIDGKLYYAINDNLISCVGSGKLSIILMRCKFNAIYRYIIDNQINLLYIRYVHIANPFFIRFLKKLKKSSVKIYMEVPTYPYDNEYINSKGRVKLLLKIENIYRKQFEKCVDKIVTVQNYDTILNIPTIKISNGINLKDIPLRSPKHHKGFFFIGVANLEMWHGYDRLIEGIGKYYENGGKEDVQFYIVGKKDLVENDYLRIARFYNISNRIHMEGAKLGKNLDYYFDMADLAIGGLAAHRKGIYEGKALKCVEYASRGIPFIYSDYNNDFDECPFIKRVKQDESPIDIDEVISFCRNVREAPQDIRSYVESKITWDIQMKRVLDDIN